MTKFHVNPVTGVPGVCTAEFNCKYGPSAPHADSRKDAIKEFELMQNGSFGEPETKTKSSSKIDEVYLSLNNRVGEINQLLSSHQLTANAPIVDEQGDRAALRAREFIGVLNAEKAIIHEIQKAINSNMDNDDDYLIDRIHSVIPPRPKNATKTSDIYQKYQASVNTVHKFFRDSDLSNNDKVARLGLSSLVEDVKYYFK